MNFFADQEKARKSSNRLFFAFVLVAFLVALVTATFLTVTLGYNTIDTQYGSESISFIQILTQHNKLLVYITAIVFVLIIIVSLVKTILIGGDGKKIAESLGAKKINLNSTDPLIKRYRNVVEEISLASGVAVPALYILDSESSINAFAAGTKIHNAAICVTRGTLERLNRDELQGVIAHEYSHIFNGDMKLNLNMIGILFGLSCIFEIGIQLARSSRYSRGNKKDSGPLIGIGLAAIGGLGYFFANLLRSAFSRQREFLADATSVQYTRNPEGIGGALKKIYVTIHEQYLKAPKAGEISHMAFSRVSKVHLFDTHPPLPKRLEAIFGVFDQSHFKKVEAEKILVSMIRKEDSTLKPLDNETKVKIKDHHNMHSESHLNFNNQNFLNPGTFDPSSMMFAAVILNQLEKKVKHDLRDKDKFHVNSLALICSMQSEELDYDSILEKYFPEVKGEVKELVLKFKAQDKRSLIPVLEILGQHNTFDNIDFVIKLDSCLEEILKMDRKISFREYLAYSFLSDCFNLKKKYKKIKLIKAISSLISFLIYLELIKDESEQLQIINEIKSNCKFPKLELVPYEEINYSLIESALINLKASKPKVKEKVYEILIYTTKYNNKVSLREYEILRLVCHKIDIPAPPLSPDY